MDPGKTKGFERWRSSGKSMKGTSRPALASVVRRLSATECHDGGTKSIYSTRKGKSMATLWSVSTSPRMSLPSTV